MTKKTKRVKRRKRISDQHNIKHPLVVREKMRGELWTRAIGKRKKSLRLAWQIQTAEANY